MRSDDCFECVNQATHWFFPQGWIPCCDLSHSCFPIATHCKDFASVKPVSEPGPRNYSSKCPCRGGHRHRGYVNARELLDDPYPLRFATDFDGSCPCCKITGQDFRVIVHCWRSFCVYGCEFAGIHVIGCLPKQELQQIADHIRNNNGWSQATEWNVTISWVDESKWVKD